MGKLFNKIYDLERQQREAEQAANGETTKDSCAKSAESAKSPLGVTAPSVRSAGSPQEEILARPQKAGTSQSSNQDMPPELERLIALGTLLREGTIKAVKCGIKGHRCTVCQGVPCVGSVPWEDA